MLRSLRGTYLDVVCVDGEARRDGFEDVFSRTELLRNVL